jgi:hypothetical protein
VQASCLPPTEPVVVQASCLPGMTPAERGPCADHQLTTLLYAEE